MNIKKKMKNYDYYTSAIFETDNTRGELRSYQSSSNNNWTDIVVNFDPNKEFKDNVSFSIYNKDGEEVLNQDTLGSIKFRGNTNYLNQLRSKSILSAIADSFRITNNDLRTITDIDIISE